MGGLSRLDGRDAVSRPGMLSAERYPIVLYGPLQLPAYASKGAKSIIAFSHGNKGSVRLIPFFDQSYYKISFL